MKAAWLLIIIWLLNVGFSDLSAQPSAADAKQLADLRAKAEAGDALAQFGPVWWGLGYLFIPFVSLFFVASHWDVAKKPFLRCLCAGLFFIGLCVCFFFARSGFEVLGACGLRELGWFGKRRRNGLVSSCGQYQK